MKALIVAIVASALVAGAVGSAGAAPDMHGDRMHNDQMHGDQHFGWGHDYGGAHNWRRGERMGYNDWSSAQPLDYRQHHLRRPPYGYEWRESNGQYILAAVATGVIASIIINGGR